VTPVIEMNHLTKSFGPITAVQDMTLSVEEGEVFGVLGPNGAGKTTMVRLLNGILTPSGGTVRLYGMDPVARVPKSAGGRECSPNRPLTTSV
jgi:ABC-2 type transport system ATP-binding protein